MIEAIEKNLQRGISLLNTISNEEYSDSSVAPYYSSIGCHIRHVLDVFSCIFEGLNTNTIFLNKRKRNQFLELETSLGIDYFNETIYKLREINTVELEKTMLVTDDLGMGLQSVNYTLGAILMQAHSHTIHHFASIGYIIYQLGIELPDTDFGFNPTSPKKTIENS